MCFGNTIQYVFSFYSVPGFCGFNSKYASQPKAPGMSENC